MPGALPADASGRMGAWAGKDFCHHGWPLPSFLLHIDQGKGGKQEVPHHWPWVPKMARLSFTSGKISTQEGVLNVWPERALAKNGSALLCFLCGCHNPQLPQQVFVSGKNSPNGQTSAAWPKTWLSYSFPICVHACMLSHYSRVWFFVTLWTVAHQAPLSMGLSRQEYWSGLPCPPPGDLPNQGIKTASLASPALTGRFFTHWATWEAPTNSM